MTVDLVEGKRATGGAVSYAAAVAAAHGIRACIVTSAGADADLSIFEGHELHVVPSPHTLTFEHTYTWFGNNRKLRVTAQPNATLSIHHVPLHCRRARVVLACPLTDTDVNATALGTQSRGFWDSLTGFQQHVGLMAQGLQRGLDAQGRVFPYKSPSSQLEAALNPRVSVFLSDVETQPWANGTLQALAAKSARFLVTRGELGADEWSAQGVVNVPPAKREAAVDTNGAGDTFATAYMLALARGHSRPAEMGNWAAGKGVMQPQGCKPACSGEAIRAELAQQRMWGLGVFRQAVHALGLAFSPFGAQAGMYQQAAHAK